MRVKINQRITEVNGVFPVKTKSVDFDGERVFLIHRATKLVEDVNGLGIDEMFTTHDIRITNSTPHVGNLTVEIVDRLIKEGLEKGYVDIDAIGDVKVCPKIVDVRLLWMYYLFFYCVF